MDRELSRTLVPTRRKRKRIWRVGNNITGGVYEIEKLTEERNMRQWTEISFSTLYYELKKLQQKKFVTAKTTLSKNNIAQKIYTINTNGKKVMKEKIIELLPHVEKIVWQIDLGIANICLLDQDGAIIGQNHSKNPLILIGRKNLIFNVSNIIFSFLLYRLQWFFDGPCRNRIVF